MRRKVWKLRLLITGLILCLICSGTFAFAQTPELEYEYEQQRQYQDGQTIWLRGGTVTIKAPEGYTISSQKDDPFGESLAFEEGEALSTVYLKDEGGQIVSVDLPAFRWDHTAPSIRITVDRTDEQGKPLTTKPIADTFLKSDVTAAIAAADAESGIESISYYLADKDLLADIADEGEPENLIDDFVADQWKPYSEGMQILLKKGGMNLLYVKAIDHVGNVTYAYTDGYYVFEDVQMKTTAVQYIKSSQSDHVVEADWKGNTIKGIKLGNEDLPEGQAYQVDAAGNVILKGAWLDSLETGRHTLTISYNPLGKPFVNGEAPTDTQLRLMVAQWGEAVIENNVEQFVDENGMTSVAVGGHETIWLKASNEEYDAWYGLGNQDGVFREGSRFWVKWLNKKADPELWQQYYDQIDERHKSQVEDDHMWIFLVGVTDPSGENYSNFGGKQVPVYIQLGEDWDKDDLKAGFLTPGPDEVVETDHVSGLPSPGGADAFGVMRLQHFSAYMIYDELTEEEKTQPPGGTDGSDAGEEEGEDSVQPPGETGGDDDGDTDQADPIVNPEQTGEQKDDAEKTADEAEKEAESSKETPKTGDPANLFAWIAVLIASAVTAKSWKRIMK